MKMKLMTILFFSFLAHNSYSQFAENNPDSIKTRKWLAPAVHVTAVGASLYALNKSWYAKYPSQSFHTVNDMNNWRMMDKCGHAWSAYNLARLSAPVWQQSGSSKKQAVYYAGFTALSYQTIIELCDGFSSKWGFSWGDMGANITGTLTYVLQEALLNKQVVQIKFSSFKKINYSPDIYDRADFLFGHTFSSRLLNDYNAQTYWASINFKSVFPKTKLPGWFNIALGYGARQMLGETNNRWTNKNNVVVDRSDITRYSRFLISPDIDFTQLKTHHTWLRVLLFVANAIKIPAPALEYNSRGKFNFHLLLLN